MEGQVCEVSNLMGAGLALFAIVEFWLGKTQLVKAGSTIELILNMIKRLLGRPV